MLCSSIAEPKPPLKAGLMLLPLCLKHLRYCLIDKQFFRQERFGFAGEARGGDVSYKVHAMVRCSEGDSCAGGSLRKFNAKQSGKQK